MVGVCQIFELTEEGRKIARIKNRRWGGKKIKCSTKARGQFQTFELCFYFGKGNDFYNVIHMEKTGVVVTRAYDQREAKPMIFIPQNTEA